MVRLGTSRDEQYANRSPGLASITGARLELRRSAFFTTLSLYRIHRDRSSSRISYSTRHCFALYISARSCFALSISAQGCFALYISALSCFALYISALSCFALYISAQGIGCIC